MNEQESRELKELKLLYEISRVIGETLDLKDALKPVLKMMSEHMEMHRGILSVINRKTGELFIEEALGLTKEECEKISYLPGEGITGRVANTGKPAIVPRISEEPEFLDRTGSRKHLEKKDISFICVPIKIGKEVIGTLSVDRLFDDRTSFEVDIRLLTIIASNISQVVRIRQLAQEQMDRVFEENQRLQHQLKDRYRPSNIIGNSKTMRNVYDLIEKVAIMNTTVLILGESGVGKEKVAHAIHFSSTRAGKPFIKFNCAALPESLIESELFGHEKGAFTGAVGLRKGRFELADCGTIFLDEIGELPPSIQGKLLRILQEKEFERVGGNQTIKLNVRIVAATNRDLEKLMKEGKFREDLYYRLNVFPLVVPPLRERRTDIVLLADHFVSKYSNEHGKNIQRISTPAIDMLMAYHWPGNVRELENCIERAVILSTDGVIHSYHLPPSLQMDGELPSEGDGGRLKPMIEKIEREVIIEELKRSKGNMAKAARELGVSERIIGLRVEKYNIDVDKLKG